MLSDLASHAAEWLRTAGREADVVISSRVRLARNVAGFPFLTRASEAQQREIEETARDAITSSGCAPGLEYFSLPEIPASQRQLFVERHLVSRELAEADHPCGVGFGDGEALSVMVNEEDHLRVQGLQAGLELRKAWDQVNAADTAIEGRVPYAFDTDLGYLTACPTNVGTGIRVSVMLHLPALAITGELQKVFASAAKIDFVVRGTYGESSGALGDFYQVSNQKTLGRSEEEIIAKLEAVIPEVVGYERRVRDALLKDDRAAVEDRVFRAYGILRYARSVPPEEALHLLSHLRLGVNMGILPGFELKEIDPLFVLTQPAHLQFMRKQELTDDESNAVRANFLRQCIRTDNGDKAGTSSP